MRRRQKAGVAAAGRRRRSRRSGAARGSLRTTSGRARDREEGRLRPREGSELRPAPAEFFYSLDDGSFRYGVPPAGRPPQGRTGPKRCMMKPSTGDGDGARAAPRRRLHRPGDRLYA